MGEPDRDGLLLLDLAVLAGIDVRRDLDGAAIDVEEPEAVSASRGLHLARLVDELHAALGESLGERVDSRLVLCTERQQLQALLGVLTQPHDVLLRRSLGGEEADAALVDNLGEPPRVLEELPLLLEVGYG